MVKLALGKDPKISKVKIGKQLSLKQVISSKLAGKEASFKDTKYITYFADPLARAIKILKL